jgi:hypothetical protein
MFGTSPFSSAPFADMGTEEYELSAGALDAGQVLLMLLQCLKRKLLLHKVSYVQVLPY